MLGSDPLAGRRRAFDRPSRPMVTVDPVSVCNAHTRRTRTAVVSRVRAVTLFLALGTLWGASFPAIEVGLTSLPPVLFAALRYDVAAFLLLAYAVVTASGSGQASVPRPRTRADVVGVGAGGVFLVAGNSLLFVGQQYTTGGVAAIIYSLIPILTTFFAWRLLPAERLSPTGFAGIVLAFLGVLIVARPDPANLLAAGVLGKTLVLCAAASVAFGSVLVRRADPTLDDVTFTGWAMGIGALCLHAGSLLADEPLALAMTASAIGATIYLGVFATAIAFLIYFSLLDRYGPLEANLVSYVVPVVATIVGAVLLGEAITLLTLVGFAVVCCGFLLLQHRAIAAFVERARPARR